MQAFDHDLRRQSVRAPLLEEEQARADWYALLARLLLRPPDAALLAGLSGLAQTQRQSDAGGTLALPRAWHALCVAAACSPQDIGSQFDRLFVGVTLPEVNPYASLYLAGYLNEKPLAALRHTLSELGLARRIGVRDMEDHLGALCETMHLLVDAARPAEVQRAFFDAYIGSWYGACLDDLRGAAGPGFYGALAELADAFLSIEAQAFALADDGEPDEHALH